MESKISTGNPVFKKKMCLLVSLLHNNRKKMFTYHMDFTNSPKCLCFLDSVISC